MRGFARKFCIFKQPDVQSQTENALNSEEIKQNPVQCLMLISQHVGQLDIFIEASLPQFEHLCASQAYASTAYILV
jgi:hypothetical protein